LNRTTPVLGVVGDSYFAATQDLPDRDDCKDSGGKHYTEIMADQLGYDYFTLARGGCSNTAIRLQLDEMISQQVDFVIYGTTTAGRIEYPINNDFDISKGVYNFKYDHCPDLSVLHGQFNHNNIRSETLSNIVDDKSCDFVKNSAQQQAVENYLLHLYSEHIRSYQDAWIISSGVQALENANIPYLLIMIHNYDDYTDYFAKSNPRFVTSKNNELSDLLPQNYPDALRRYHTSDQSQAKIAEKTLEHIKKHSLLELSC